MNDDETVLDELFEAARDLRAPEGAEARGWARLEAALGDAGPALPGEAATGALAGLAPAAKVGGILAVVLAVGVVLAGRDEPSPPSRAAARETTTPAAPLAREAPLPRDVASSPASSAEPASPPPTPAPARVRAPATVEPRSTSSRTTTAPPIEPPAPASNSAVAEAVVVQRPATLPPVTVAPAAPPADALRREAELLGRAWVAIREGRAADTRALLAEHASQFPRGALVPERHACQLVAGCIAGEPDALDRARRYLEEHRASHLAARVADGCGLARPVRIE